VTKNLAIRGVKLLMNADLYNLFNGNAVLAQINVYGPTWQRPTAVVPGRFFKVTLQANF